MKKFQEKLKKGNKYFLAVKEHKEKLINDNVKYRNKLKKDIFKKQ